MTPTTMELAPAAPSLGGDRRGEGSSERLTLEDLVLGAWEELSATGRARCPVCGGGLDHAGCDGCGSKLS